MATSSERPADVREMAMSHDMFRREFGLLAALVRDVAPDDRARLEAVAGHIELLVSAFARGQRGEDAHLWPRLVERVSHDDDRSVVQLMARQHGALHDLGADLADALGAWRDEVAAVAAAAVPAAAAGERLAGILELMNAAIRYHLAMKAAAGAYAAHARSVHGTEIPLDGRGPAGSWR